METSTGRGAYGVYQAGELNWQNGTQLFSGLAGGLRDKLKTQLPHAVPRHPFTTLEDLEDLTRGIRNNGFKVKNAILINRMPVGRLILEEGHHRLKAMKNLKQPSIPSLIRNWTDLNEFHQKDLIRRFPWIYGEF